MSLFETIKTINYDQFPEDVRLSFEEWIDGCGYSRGYIAWWTSSNSDDNKELQVNKWLIENGIIDGERILINWDW